MIPSGTAMAVAVAVITIVPTTAGPIPGPSRRTGGIDSVRKSHEITEAPLLMTVTKTKTSGTITTTRDRPIKTVATPLRTLRPERFGDRSIAGARAVLTPTPATCGPTG